MATEDDLLIGEMAVNHRMISEEQVKECLKIQETTDPYKPLGKILVEKDYLTVSQLDYLIRLQEEKLDELIEEEDDDSQDLRDTLFGRIARRKGWVTEEQLDECLREKSSIERLRIYFRLGEIMVKKGYMTPEQVEDILSLQNKKILYCPDCSTWFNTLFFDKQILFTCSVCGGKLDIPDRKGNVTVRETLAMEKMPSHIQDERDLDEDDFLGDFDEIREEVEGIEDLVREIRELETELWEEIKDD